MKEDISLSQVMEFSTGFNSSRIGNDISEEWIYSLDDFDKDLAGSKSESVQNPHEPSGEKGIYAKEGDCVISMTRTKAAIISKASEGKLLTVNFVKCVMDESKLDPWYFCYLFNDSNEVRQQMQKLQQGTVSCISRLNIATIGALKIEEITIERQRKLGQMYRQVLLEEALRKKQMEEIKRASLEMIRKLKRESY